MIVISVISHWTCSDKSWPCPAAVYAFRSRVVQARPRPRRHNQVAGYHSSLRVCENMGYYSCSS